MTPLYGFVKIYRKLLRWGWYQDNVVKGVFLHILLTANFEDMLWQGRTIKRGQLVTTLRRMADELGFSVRQVRTALEKLETTEEITKEVTNKFSLITVAKWEEYQLTTETVTNKRHTKKPFFESEDFENPENLTNKKSTKPIATNEISDFENENVTNKRQTNDKQTPKKATHNKEIYKKNDKNNIKKEKYKKERSPAEPSFDELINHYTENEELRFELKEHLKTRKAKKATLTNHAIELSFRTLDKLAQDDDNKIKIVQQSIECGWTSFYQLKENQTNGEKENGTYQQDNIPDAYKVGIYL